jgi:hypothetical protein
MICNGFIIPQSNDIEAENITFEAKITGRATDKEDFKPSVMLLSAVASEAK